MSDEERRAREAAAIEFAIRRTIPIIQVLGDDYAIYGSGTLYRNRGEHFLVTATHVLDELVAGRITLGLPLDDAAPPGAGFTGKVNLLPSHKHDVGAILLPIETVDMLSRGGYYQFVDGDATLERPHGDYAGFFAFGYPSATINVANSEMVGAPIGCIRSTRHVVTTGARGTIEFGHGTREPRNLAAACGGVARQRTERQKVRPATGSQRAHAGGLALAATHAGAGEDNRRAARPCIAAACTQARR